MIDVVVIGAGLTGLTSAFYLNKKGKDILVLEERDVVGGQISTVSSGEFLYEKGPNTGVLSAPEVVELLEDLGIEDQLEIAHKESKKRLIWKGKKFYPIPYSLNTAIFTPLFTLKDKISLPFEPMRKRGEDPHETLANLVRRRLGDSFLNYAVDPFLSGIYAGDPETLVTKYAMPKLYNLEQNYGSFIKGAIAKGREPKSERDKKATKEIFSLKGGLSTIIDALARSVGSQNIELSAKGVTLEYLGESWRVTYSCNGEKRVVECRDVITTVGAFRLDELFKDVHIEELSRVTSLRYSPVVQVSVGVENCDNRGFKAFGALVPSIERRKVLGILYPSSCFDNRAPKNGLLLSIFMGGARNLDICDRDDQEIRNDVEAELESMLNVSKSQISMMNIFRYPKAIAQYESDQGDRLEAIRAIEGRFMGLHLAGALRDGIGIPDRIKQGVNLARDINN